MKIRILLLIALLFSPMHFANSPDSTIVGPGVIHYHEVIDSGPWNINIIKIDMKNSWLNFQSVKAGDKLQAFERTSSMAARNNFEEHRVVAAINGDFYNTSTGEQVGTQIADGELLKVTGDWLNVAFDVNKNPMIGMQSFSGFMLSGDSIRSIAGVNRIRNTDELILYNSFKGVSTGTNQYGTEVLIFPVDEWLVNDTIRCVVEKIESDAGNMPLVQGKAVLSGHGISGSFLLNNLNSGDTIHIILKLNPALPRLGQLIGGNTWLVKDGIVNTDNGDRHPRTSVGFNIDSTLFFMFVVDGRQPELSVGMSYKELGDYMKSWGVYQGLNLDGGGSSTMVVRGTTVNSPSDGGERSVSNSLLLISTAQTGELAHLRIKPGELFVLGGSILNMTISGFDQYYNPVSIPTGTLAWSCDQSIGSIDQNGEFIAASDTVSGYIYASSGSITDSALVHLTKISRIVLEPDPVILQPGQSQQMSAAAYDNYDNLISLQQTDFQWSVSGVPGSISASGYFTATGTGDGEIIAKIDTVSGSAQVFVGLATTIVIDDFSDISGYTLTGTRVNLPQCSFVNDYSNYISEPSSGKLNYSLTTGGTSAIYLNKDISVSGVPERLSIQVYGDGKKHWLRGEFRDNDNEIFLLNFTAADPGIDWINTWKYIEVSLSEAVPSWSNPAAVLTFPVKWTRIYLAETSDSKKDAGAISLDDFRAHYIVTNTEDESVLPGEFRLFQNYPNPFNPLTSIQYAIASRQYVQLTVYDILGNEVAKLVDEYKEAGRYEVEFQPTIYSRQSTVGSSQLTSRPGSALTSGVYFYQLRAGEYTAVKKMLLIR